MSTLMIKLLAKLVQERRGTKGIREAAGEVGVSPATLSRVENGKVPDLETFSKICRWLGDDPAAYLGLTPLQTEPERIRRLLLDAAHKAITDKRIKRLELVVASLARLVPVTGPPSAEQDELRLRLYAIRQDLAEVERKGGNSG